MKKALLLPFLFLAFHVNAQVSSLLAIKPRLQWQNANGYCGETSIQMCGLYYGNYISQNLCRTVAGGEVLINLNDTAALSAFSFTFSEWDPSVATPQYMNYLDWVKHYLYKKQPVIITVYVQGLSDPDYDHIFPAIGFTAGSVSTYAGTDQLTYNSCFDTTSFTRAFANMYDTRSMAGNGATYTYCIPQNVDFGVAVTGIKDPARQCRPVHMVIDSLDEPNVSLSAAPRMMKAWITADSLTPGQGYALLRYNNYGTVPSTGFSPANASSAVYFTATGINQLLKDSFMSNTGVFYRCIPHTVTGMHDLAVWENKAEVYPNPSNGDFRVVYPTGTTNLCIVDIRGRIIREADASGQADADLYIDEAGIYFLRFSGNYGTISKKMVVSK
ncbi:MAG: T9SS type A sorting domain-containing protein [Bacteroidia bacterium]